MRIESNIKEVAARFGRLTKGVDAAVQRALRPEMWLEPLRQNAEASLRAAAAATNATTEDREWIPDFARAITTQVFHLGFGAFLKAPRADSGTLSAALQALDAARLRGEPEGLFDGVSQGEAVDTAREAIRKWVATRKRKDEGQGGVDEGLSNEQIADRIEWFVLDPNPDLFKADAARDLSLAIEEFILETGSGRRPLREELVDAWLRTVLSGWRDFLRRELGPAIMRELQAVAGGQ